MLLDGLLIHGLLGVHWLLLGVSSVLLLGDSSVLLLRWLSVNNLLGLRVDHLLLTVLDGLGVDDLGLSVDNLRLLRLLLELLTEAAAAHAEAAEAASEGARAEKAAEAHAWSELLAEATLLELVLQGKPAERGWGEDGLLVEVGLLFLGFDLFGLWGLGRLDVGDLTANLDAAGGLVLGALGFQLAADLELGTGLDLVLLLEITAEFQLAAELCLSACLQLVADFLLLLKWLNLVADLELTTISASAMVTSIISTAVWVLLLAVAAAVGVLLLAVATGCLVANGAEVVGQVPIVQVVEILETVLQVGVNIEALILVDVTSAVIIVVPEDVGLTAGEVGVVSLVLVNAASNVAERIAAVAALAARAIDLAEIVVVSERATKGRFAE